MKHDMRRIVVSLAILMVIAIVGLLLHTFSGNIEGRWMLVDVIDPYRPLTSTERADIRYSGSSFFFDSDGRGETILIRGRNVERNSFTWSTDRGLIFIEDAWSTEAWMYNISRSRLTITDTDGFQLIFERAR